MTKSEIISYLKAYLNGDTAIGNIIPLRTILESAIKYLEPSLPSNLDEAAEKNFETMEVLEHENIFEETHRKIFKAGAEWMAGQGVSVEGKVIMDFSDPDDIINRRLIAKLGDALLKVEPGDVIIQIREK